MSSRVVSVKTYVTVFVALLLLLASTVAVAVVEHPAVGLSIALGIAGTKALLIVLFFMNVRHDTASVRLAAVAGFLWLALLISLSLADLLTRGWYPASQIRPTKVAPTASRPAAVGLIRDPHNSSALTLGTEIVTCGVRPTRMGSCARGFQRGFEFCIAHSLLSQRLARRREPPQGRSHFRSRGRWCLRLARRYALRWRDRSRAGVLPLLADLGAALSWACTSLRVASKSNVATTCTTADTANVK